MSEREAEAFLLDMLEAARRILAYTQGLDYPDFRQDLKTQDAGRQFSEEQLEWLGMIKDHIATSVTI